MKWKLEKVLSLVESSSIDVLIVTQPSNVTYLTGVAKSSGITLVVEKNGSTTALTPALDYWRVIDTTKLKELVVVPYGVYQLPDIDLKLVEPPHVYIPKMLKEAGITKAAVDNPFGRIAFEVEKNLGTGVRDLSESIADLRSIKHYEEIELMKKALSITERAVEKTVSELKPGMTEKYTAAVVEYYMKHLGADGLAFESIVAFGSNAAYPHAAVTDRVLREEDCVVLDVGAQFESYSSDLTRTVLIGSVDREIKRAFEAVSEAVDSAIDSVYDGIAAHEVDGRAREVLRRAGLGKYFIHSLGHGIGIEVHEKPRLAQGSKDILRDSMVVTIEPGVYIPGRYGIRIENMVLIRKSGAEVLNKLAKLLEV
ncbi:MAG: aminopeptidase P family protein [Sulfolobales archaeon]|nr:aminopeptidase P family protein [Sulfolobales archaeon]MDW8083293.1 aminopeptidase P family protein [Sulfolobales archaeon]